MIVAASLTRLAFDPLSRVAQSVTLFVGYAAAAFELRAQLESAGVIISPDAPLVVHIPCGVGGAPGGICWGLHHAFPSECLRVLFAEPTGSPCVTVALASGMGAGVCVADLGIEHRVHTLAAICYCVCGTRLHVCVCTHLHLCACVRVRVCHSSLCVSVLFPPWRMCPVARAQAWMARRRRTVSHVAAPHLYACACAAISSLGATRSMVRASDPLVPSHVFAAPPSHTSLLLLHVLAAAAHLVPLP